jgi:hypothetical protein
LVREAIEPNAELKTDGNSLATNPQLFASQATI